MSDRQPVQLIDTEEDEDDEEELDPETEVSPSVDLGDEFSPLVDSASVDAPEAEPELG